MSSTYAQIRDALHRIAEEVVSPARVQATGTPAASARRLIVVRGVPAALYRLDLRRTLAAGLLQATSLPLIVAATVIGTELGLVDVAQSAALVGAGLLSVLLFPVTSLAVLRGAPRAIMAA